MKALIRKPFHYATRDLIVGAIVEFPDAVFEEFKRERLVTEAPPEELPLAMPAEMTLAKSPLLTAKPAAAPAKSKRK
jgi:hypothetical protein